MGFLTPQEEKAVFAFKGRVLKEYVFTDSDASERLAEVKEFLSAAENLLRASGFLE